MSLLSIPVSFGEATDKVTILEIKRARITDPAKLANIEAELKLVADPVFARAKGLEGFERLFAMLKEINGRLWDIEEDIRQHERRGDFGAEFVRLARAVYQTNDERTRVKRELDLLSDSPIREEKSYVEHDKPLA
jgi:hypothetical protein